MTDELLTPFVRAYRQENPGTKLDAVSIRRRVIVGIGSRERRRAVLLRVLLPVAATFFGSVALAASHGGFARLVEVQKWFQNDAQAPAPVTEPGPHRPRMAKARHGTAPPASPSEPSVAPPSASTEASPPGVSLDELPVAPAPSARTQVPSAASAEPSGPKTEPVSEDIAAYEAAHRLHFHAHDSASALAAWDTYLARYPRGVFAPEARFNRAVCLLRLGRRTEAREALARIADARAGSYGRERAQAFLDAMGD